VKLDLGSDSQDTVSQRLLGTEKYLVFRTFNVNLEKGIALSVVDGVKSINLNLKKRVFQKWLVNVSMSGEKCLIRRKL